MIDAGGILEIVGGMYWNFINEKICREERFSIAKEVNTGKYYLSIPVINPFIAYEEHYEISEPAFREYESDMKKALDFVRACRERKNDHLLLEKPGEFRGDPC